MMLSDHYQAGSGSARFGMSKIFVCGVMVCGLQSILCHSALCAPYTLCLLTNFEDIFKISSDNSRKIFSRGNSPGQLKED